MDVLEGLIRSFSKLPGIGRKSAARIAYYLLKADPSFTARFASQIETLQSKIHPCGKCGGFTEDDLCSICSNPDRDKSSICVVEQSEDIRVIEETREYNGVYHVLGGVISPLEGVGPEDLRITSLMQRVKTDEVQEVIIAANPTVEGDTTALYLVKQLQPMPCRVSRLASGLPVGGDLEYADRLTLARSLRDRAQMGGSSE